MKIVLVSNGSLAQSLLDSMKNYFSEPELTAVCFESPDWQKGRDALAWAIRKGDQDTLNWFNNYLRQIKGDGSYDRLYKKWFESTAWLNQLK
mgnify:CR=1 FL=1